MDRFWAKVTKTAGCWLWTASTVRGYGQFRRAGQTLKTHRVSWEAHFGSIPAGLDVLHQCDVRNCVNPQHLFLGTDKDNRDDCVAKGRHNSARGDLHGSRTRPDRLARGEAQGNAKLTAAQVRDIRARQGVLHRALAIEFGVGRRQIGRIRAGEHWGHVQ